MKDPCAVGKQALRTISIVTPVYNRAAMIAGAVESTRSQDATFEHIIIDGGSTDGTLAVLAKYAHLKVFSGPDGGMYDALNKGLQRCTGEIIGFLNADDVYESGIFGEVSCYFDENPGVDAVAGQALLFELIAGEEKRLDCLPAPQAEGLLRGLTLGIPIFNAWFFRKRVFEKVGLFDASYRIAGDREFLLRAYFAGIKVGSLDRVVYHYRHHPGSLTLSGSTEMAYQATDEDLRMADAFLSNSALDKTARKILLSWHTRNTSELSLWAFRDGDKEKFQKYVRLGFHRDWRWPLKFSNRFLHAVKVKLTKKARF